MYFSFLDFLSQVSVHFCFADFHWSRSVLGLWICADSKGKWHSRGGEVAVLPSKANSPLCKVPLTHFASGKFFRTISASICTDSCSIWGFWSKAHEVAVCYFWISDWSPCSQTGRWRQLYLETWSGAEIHRSKKLRYDMMRLRQSINVHFLPAALTFRRAILIRSTCHKGWPGVSLISTWGYDLPLSFTGSCLLIKTLGLSLAVGAGLSLGKEPVKVVFHCFPVNLFVESALPSSYIQ